MAKRKDPSGLQVLSSVLRHTNKQTFGADASVAIAEAIDNPGWDTAGKRGIRIHRIVFMPGKNELFGYPSTGPHATQIQQGDQTSAPGLKNADDADLFAQFSFYNGYVTSGGGAAIWPVDIPVISVVPIIVAERFSIAHQAVNHGAYNAMDIFTMIYYDIVKVPTDMYNAMLMQRLNQS